MADITNINDNDIEILDEDEEEIITLTTDEDDDVDFYQIAILDHEERWYIFLDPVETNENFENGKLYIFELGTDENEEDTYLPVEDEKLLDTLYNKFEALVDESLGENDEE